MAIKAINNSSVMKSEHPSPGEKNEKADWVMCGFCYTPKPKDQFQEKFTARCIHDKQYCLGCSKDHLKFNMNPKPKCPMCPETMDVYDIQRIAGQELSKSYELLITKSLLNQDPHFHSCLAPKCGSAQFYLCGEIAPRMKCLTCNQDTCLKHHVAWHEGLTCAEYEATETYETAVLQEAETTAYFDKKSPFIFNCPGCGIMVEKNGGCSHVVCTVCGAGFDMEPSCLTPIELEDTDNDTSGSQTSTD